MTTIFVHDSANPREPADTVEHRVALGLVLDLALQCQPTGGDSGLDAIRGRTTRSTLAPQRYTTELDVRSEGRGQSRHPESLADGGMRSSDRSVPGSIVTVSRGRGREHRDPTAGLLGSHRFARCVPAAAMTPSVAQIDAATI